MTSLPRLCACECSAALAYLMEIDRHDPRGITLAARRTRDGWRLAGTKLFVMGVPGAELLLVAARTGRNAVSLFLVETSAPAFAVGPPRTSISRAAGGRSILATSLSSGARSSAARAPAG